MDPTEQNLKGISAGILSGGKPDKSVIMSNLSSIKNEVEKNKTGEYYFYYAVILDYIDDNDSFNYYNKSALMDYEPAMKKLIEFYSKVNIEKAWQYYYSIRLKKDDFTISDHDYSILMEYVLKKEDLVSWLQKETRQKRDSLIIMRRLNGMIREIAKQYNVSGKIDKSIVCYETAADNGDAESMKILTDLYETGYNNVGKDQNKSEKWKKKYEETIRNGSKTNNNNDPNKKKGLFGFLKKKHQ